MLCYITFPSAVPNTIGWSAGQIKQVTALCWINLLQITFFSPLKDIKQKLHVLYREAPDRKFKGILILYEKYYDKCYMVDDLEIP